ncbi:hypothetical protein BKA69DRAFT_724233 [Paraphysoderma sedebokerense]|nr:hypothetical protein BKA69DRAFT_724233 [Paraphysoderma sedebokerense]
MNIFLSRMLYSIPRNPFQKVSWIKKRSPECRSLANQKVSRFSRLLLNPSLDSPTSHAKNTASSNRSSKVGTLIINTPNERNNQSLPNIKAKNKSDIKGKLSPTIKVVGSISNLPPPPPLTDVTDLPLTPLSMHKLVPPPPTESTTEITVPDSRPLPAPPSPLGSEHKLPKSFSHSDFTTLSRSRNGSQKRDSKDSMSNLHPATSKAQVLEIIKQQSYSLKNVQMPTEQRKLPSHPRDVLLSQIRSSSSWCDLKPTDARR